MRIWKLVKVFLRGVVVALIVSMPSFNHVHCAPQISYPKSIQIGQMPERQQLNIVYDTKSPYFLYDGTINPNFIMTWYDVKTEGGVQVSNGNYWYDDNMRVHNNDIQYYDKEYGWIQVVAVNIDQVKEFGYGKASVVNSSMLGSVIHISYPDGTSEKAIILDVCGKAREERIVDRWVYDGRQAQEQYGRLHGIEFKFMRFGFDHQIS